MFKLLVGEMKITKISKISLLLVASIILFFVIISVVRIQFSELDKELETQTIVETCLPQNEICNISIEDLDFKIRFDKNIFYLKPFSFSVWVKKGNAAKINSIHANFKMTNMDMGVNRFTLNLVNSNQSDGAQQWQGNALLPICVTGRADWVTEVEVVTSKKRYILILPLQVKK